MLLMGALAAAALSVILLVVRAWGALADGEQTAIAIGAFLVVALVAFLGLRGQLRPLAGSGSIQLKQVDVMTGAQFEACVAALLARQGYSVEHVGHSGDLGVDIVARRKGRRYAVQCKRYASAVSRRAISDAVAGVRHYGCDAAMVVTNSTFTRDAITLARDNKCVLIDRSVLAKWVRK